MERWMPHQIIAWAVETFGDGLVMSSSFQQQSMVLLHVVSVVAPSVPILFVDTGHHFAETIAFRHTVAEVLGLHVIDLHPTVNRTAHRAELWKHDPDLCCYLNKVQPMQKALRTRRAWITGIRRDQSPSRATARVVEARDDGMVKINPLVTWTRQDVQRYIEFYGLPAHPLYKRGYRSIGCAPCTRPIQAWEHDRAGRWAGKKSECGLHTVCRAQ
jgi:phosphoadenosine phosphosulfate reductase